MEVLMHFGTSFVVLAVVFGFYMTWGVGANDVANAMAPAVGSRSITVVHALILAAIFEFGGAFLAGGHVTETIRRGIIDSTAVENMPEILVFGMLAALLAAAIWLTVASSRGWPVSTTHTIVGAIVGFGLAGIGIDAVSWPRIGQIAASWIISPLLGGLIAFLLMLSIRTLILNTENPFRQARFWAPAYAFLVGFVISLVTVFRGLHHLRLDLSVPVSVLLALMVGLVVAAVGWAVAKRVQVDESADRDFHFASVERVFIPMMIFTACAMAFAHGSNDVANGIGPMAAIVSVVEATRLGAEEIVKQQSPLPLWTLVLGGVGLVMGLSTMGYQVMRTLGKRITELTPTRGYCASLAAASTVVLASRTGLPVSTTHIAVGAIIGVGMARGIGAIDLRIIGRIVGAWLVTLPVAAALAALFFFALKGMFG